jgi:hypothetical protein
MGPEIDPAEYAKVRSDADGGSSPGGHGAGIHWTGGAIWRFKFGNICDPEQLLNLYPTVIEVTLSSGETVKAIGIPWAVVPSHWPL